MMFHFPEVETAKRKNIKQTKIRTPIAMPRYPSFMPQEFASFPSIYSPTQSA
jgi:hypothetical protein